MVLVPADGKHADFMSKRNAEEHGLGTWLDMASSAGMDLEGPGCLLFLRVHRLKERERQDTGT